MQADEHHHNHAHHGHEMGHTAQATHNPTTHGGGKASAAHAIHMGEDHSASGHDKHAGHTPEMFRDRFWLSLLLTLPILYFDAHFQAWFGYQAVQFPAVAWVQPLLSAALYCYAASRRIAN